MKRKVYFKAGVVVLLFLIQISFLLAIFRENTGSYITLAFVSSLSVLILYTYRRAQIHHHELEFESFSMILWVLIGTLLTYYLHHKLNLGSVLSAAITGVLASFLPAIKPDSTYLKQLPPAIYCGAFVGMSSPRIANDFYFILAAGFFTGVLLVVSKSLLKGVGGRLGTLAFLGVSITYVLIYFLK